MVGRELTKKFETIYRGKISEVLPQIKEKGEFVLIVSGKTKKARYSEED
jgi:16S rRNA (cytidine1402-2'-O)-methyltransferase